MVTINGKYTGETLGGQILHGDGLTVNEENTRIETSMMFHTGKLTDIDGIGESSKL